MAAWMSAALIALSAPAHSAATDTKISLMVGGVEKQIYLPVILASRLGYFREQGLEVEVLTEPSGVDAEDQLLAGAVQGVVGFYDHTIDLQAKGKLVKSVVQFSRIPGEVVLVATRHGAAIRSPADLKERTVGVTGLGSSTNFLMKYLAATGGLKVGDVKPLAVGAGETFIAALTSGKISAGMTTEPTASRLLGAGQASVLVDLRSVAGTTRALGGPYPAACLYLRESWINAHKSVVRKLTSALLNARALAGGKEMFIADGRMPPDGPQTVLKVLRVADHNVQGKSIDLRRTYTDEFVEAAR